MPNQKLDYSGEVYSAYAAGTLDSAFVLMLETQAALRPEVGRAMARAETIAAAFLDREEQTPLNTSALQNMLAKIDQIECASENLRKDATLRANSGLDELLALPEPLRERALVACQASGWQNLTPGIRRMKLDVDSAAEVELYRIEPGSKVPRHSHKGSEMTLVVTGAFSDETGRYLAGDISVNGPDDEHQPIGEPGQVCMALAVHESGLRFTGLMGVFQRLIGQ